MYFVIDVVEIISFCIFLIFVIGFCIWYLCLILCDYINNLKNTKKQKRQSKQLEINKEKAIKIIDEFENLLVVNDIKIPNNERKGNEDEACIYGKDYYNLEESIIEILNS